MKLTEENFDLNTKVKNNQKEKVGFDLDDVLICFLELFVDEYNKLSGDNLQYDEITDWDLNLFVLPEWRSRLFTEIIWTEGFFIKAKSMPYAFELLKKFCDSDKYEPYIVSAAYFSTVPDKANLIMKLFPFFPIKNFVPCYDKSMIRLDYLIDDGSHNVLKVNGTETLPILMDRPHNRQFDNKKHHILRLFKLKDLEYYFFGDEESEIG